MDVNGDRRAIQQQKVVYPTKGSQVEHALECPNCGESRPGMIQWIDMECVRCSTCGTITHAWVNRSD